MIPNPLLAAWRLDGSCPAALLVAAVACSGTTAPSPCTPGQPCTIPGLPGGYSCVAYSGKTNGQPSCTCVCVPATDGGADAGDIADAPQTESSQKE